MTTYYRSIYSLILLSTLGLFSSCVNEKAEVEKVAEQELLPIESTYDSEIYYTEDASLKIEAFAPVMLRFDGEFAYNEMPEGVKVIFYDSNQVESSRLTSNYAIDRVGLNIMEAMNDVVINNADGEQLNTEHLIWNRKEKRIYSEVFVKITTDDEIIMGEGFESNEQFTKYKILKPKGTITKEDE